MQNAQYRWLCLGDTVQSVLDLARPQRLVLPHLHGLALSLYLRPNPQYITEMGLGGGAFQRFLQQYTPSATTLSVEFSSPIIHCFDTFFNPSDCQPIIRQADASEAIHHISNQDLLILDLFGEQDHPGFLRQADFYQHCLRALSASGLLVLNMLPSLHGQLDWLADVLRELTGQTCTIVGIPGYQNKVVFAAYWTLPDLHEFAPLSEFASAHHIDLNQLILL
ncbi:hypothetical protein [Lacimicrobium sp. SS2-24]|uniref:hypothetical protein n=1 Tax=Lacimicrobium sp. SS2-24 TaxID=2005569 RepID=UPI000B4B87EE|nr:hypothetical protein [Lacimicrobium sp. SS2-24]